MVMDRHHGVLPVGLDALTALPGIGRSTAGAIRSLAHGEREPILDGNCKRVLARCFSVPGWPGRGDVLAALWRLAEKLTPDERVGPYNQAMMDLGATLCTRTAPDCARCPLAQCCMALRQGAQHAYPAPKPKRENKVRRTRLLLAATPDGRVLLERRAPTGVWGGLWVPPALADAELGRDWEAAATDWCRQRLGTESARVRAEPHPRLEILPPRRHSFTHFHLDIDAALLHLPATPARVSDAVDAAWVDPAAPGNLGLPAPIRRLLDEVAVRLTQAAATGRRPHRDPHDTGELT
jgi:A/G-specific adenine glycosylase